MPMKYFTLEETSPSETTLNLIRQIAHTYRVLHLKDSSVSYCLN